MVEMKDGAIINAEVSWNKYGDFLKAYADFSNRILR